ncbi:MAG: hypothetical protein MUC42_06675 [Bryobacter sp.]|jgi:hypothetical protein|nr:hypothetical protein [Bryobacter sp.]
MLGWEGELIGEVQLCLAPDLWEGAQVEPGVRIASLVLEQALLRTPVRA